MQSYQRHAEHHSNHNNRHGISLEDATVFLQQPHNEIGYCKTQERIHRQQVHTAFAFRYFVEHEYQNRCDNGKLHHAVHRAETRPYSPELRHSHLTPSDSEERAYNQQRPRQQAGKKYREIIKRPVFMTFIRHLAEKTSKILLHHQVKEAVASNMESCHIPT